MPGESARINGRKGGRPKGSVGLATLTKQAIRDRVQALVSAQLDGLTVAQIAQAKGLKYLVRRDPATGKFERIGPEGIDGEGVIEVWEKDPSTAAFTDLMNRAADKPKDQPIEVTVTVGLEARKARLASARERLTLSGRVVDLVHDEPAP
jgi:hypothetical protein